MITNRHTLQFEEYKTALNLIRKQVFKRLRNISIFLTIAYVVGPFILQYFAPEKSIPELYKGFGGVLILPFIVFVFHPILLAMGAKKSWEKESELRSEKEYLFTEEQVSIKSEAKTETISWSNIGELFYGEGLFLLVGPQGKVHIVPRRGFDNNETDQFQELVEKVTKQTFITT